jgi:hypothetical protein
MFYTALLYILQVRRQHEHDLIHAVNELCNGSPSDDTIQLLRSLDRPLDDSDSDSTKLYGTNFDVCYVNQMMLDEMDGEVSIFKSKDDGKVKLLRFMAVQKTIVVKKGAPVILVKNIGAGLFNGMRGTVHSISADNLPVVNFDGKLVPLSMERFDVYDKEQRKVLASRLQVPIMLAFALTVHRAQGQTLPAVEVDCHSFFAPGQMGVAIGRATNKAGLRVRNFNKTAAHLKHPPCVYEFYDKDFQQPLEDLSCCRSVHVPDPDDQPSTSQSMDSEDTGIIPAPEPPEGLEPADPEHPQLNSPWSVQEFIEAMESAPFISCVSAIAMDTMETHLRYLYHKVHNVTSKPPATPQQWTTAYSDINNFLVSHVHILLIKQLFGVESVTRDQNKFSTKLMFWLMDKQIKTTADDIIKKQAERVEGKRVTDDTPRVSAAGKAKIRYIAGACVQKITKRLQESVLRNLGKSTKLSRLSRKFDYKKRQMMLQFRIREGDIAEPEKDESLSEIQFKQGPTRGLSIVSDDVFDFFSSLNAVVQGSFTSEQFHLHLAQLHVKSRNVVDNDTDLLEKWLALFGSVDEEDLDDEIFLNLVMELFRDITEYFIKVALVDSLKEFKKSVPRRKKQALRAKITALGQAAEKKRKVEEETPEESDSCNICHTSCEWEPATVGDESIACDTCNCWHHYKCVNLTGQEPFLKRKTKWFCPNCSKKGKGTGKRTGKGPGKGRGK